MCWPAGVVGHHDRAGREPCFVADRDQPGVTRIEIDATRDEACTTEFETLGDEAVDVLLSAQPLEHSADCTLERLA